MRAFRLLCQAEEWSPIKQRRVFPLPRILLKFPPEPLPFYPCHPTHPLNTLQGTVRVRFQKYGFVFLPVGVKDRDNSVRSVGRGIGLRGTGDANISDLNGKMKFSALVIQGVSFWRLVFIVCVLVPLGGILQQWGHKETYEVTVEMRRC